MLPYRVDDDIQDDRALVVVLKVARRSEGSYGREVGGEPSLLRRYWSC